MALYFCTEVDGRLCIFHRSGGKDNPQFDVAAYETNAGWICLGPAEQQNAIQPQLQHLANRWKADPFFGRGLRKSTRNVIRKPLGAGDLLPTLALIEFQKSLVLLLSKAQVLVGDHAIQPTTADVLVHTYKGLAQHMALDTLLWMAKQHRQLLKSSTLTKAQGAAIWDSIFHAHVRLEHTPDALNALEKAVTYEDNATRRALMVRLQSQLEKDEDLLQTCTQLAEMRPLLPHELARRGMAEMRRQDETALRATIATLQGHTAPKAQQYATRLMGYLHE